MTSASGSSASDTTTVNNPYVQPSFVALLSSGRFFFAVSGSILVVPNISYGGTQPETWIAYGAEGQIGARF